MNSNYETLYGVGFLDDLHNYFPALLYDSSSFGSVREMLAYIQSQARNRFDLFSYGQREYLSTHPPASVPVVSPLSDSYQRRVVRTSFASMPPLVPAATSTLLRQAVPATPPTIPVSANPMLDIHDEINRVFPAMSASTIQQFLGRPTNMNVTVDLSQILTQPQQEDDGDEADTEEADQEDAQAQYITNTLLSLLRLPMGNITRNYVTGTRTMDEFLQPVVIRPTPEQIAENTTVGNLVSDTDHSCAICQDALTSEQEGRKLNACGHWFHKTCIDTWLNANVHCPVCRHDIRELMPSTSG
jgi:hypothetical protein